MSRALANTFPVAFLVASGLAFGGGCGGSPAVNPPTMPTITSVSVSCSTPSVEAGQTDSCSATVTGTGSFSMSVTWTASTGAISSSGLFTAPNAAGSVTLTATSVTSPAKSGSATVTVPPTQKSGFAYRGITHTSFNANEYNTGAGTISQDALADTGAAWAGVLVTQYQADKNATSIAPASNTPSDAAIIAAITELHSKGLKVMLKPHVDALDGAWRGTFTPSDTNAWFASFTSFIVHYAQIAQDNGVELLCIGTEYVQLSGSANRSQWLSVITAIKTTYTGSLAYAANATFAGDEFTSVSFWDKVDVIGLDGYFPLTDHSDPTVSQLVSAWSSNKDGLNIVAAVTNFASAQNPAKPVIFTEIGYRSVAGANTAPFDFTLAGAVDTTEQENCYEAMYEVWSPRTSILKGNFWWDWSVAVPAADDTDYTPWTKPAETVLRIWQ
jgi:hypothetical protein